MVWEFWFVKWCLWLILLNNRTNLSSETLFLTYYQILESYHRKRYSGTYTSEEKFEEFKSKFIKCTTKMEGLDELVSKENKANF